MQRFSDSSIFFGKSVSTLPEYALYSRAAVKYQGAAAHLLEGHVAEWLRTGLQNRVRRFNSGRGLHIFF
jgi:hypothetical protein